MTTVSHDGGVVPRVRFLGGGRGRPGLLPPLPPSAGVQVSGDALPSEGRKGNFSVKQIDALVRYISSSSCSPVVPVLPPHGRAHRLEVRLAAETPDVPQLDGLVLAVGDEVATVSPAEQFTLVFAISP